MELVSRIAKTSGLDPEMTRQGVEILLAILAESAPSDDYDRLFSRASASKHAPQERETTNPVQRYVYSFLEYRLLGEGSSTAPKVLAELTKVGFSPDQAKKFILLTLEQLKEFIWIDTVK